MSKSVLRSNDATKRTNVVRPTKQEIETIHRDLRRWSILYYRGTPEVSDWDFDCRYRTLVIWEDRWPDLITPDSPTQVVQYEDDPEVQTHYPWGEPQE